jgi:hypothetical protein
MARETGLTVAAIAAWVGETSFSRGRPYIARLLDQRRTGPELKARCVGSAAQPYRVTATLTASGGIAGSTCSCPVGGRCKHIAALLMAWIAEPDAFQEVEPLDAALERRDKAELIALIRQMLARHPELETLLELPLPTAGGKRKPADPAVIRRQVLGAFNAAGDDWHAAATIADALGPLVEIGDDYGRLGDWHSAATVYQTVAATVLDQYTQINDEEGSLHAVVDHCVGGLGECIDAASDSLQREALLRALFDIYRWDVDYGGIDMGAEAPGLILAHATADEQRLVAGWASDAMREANISHTGWRREAFGHFLLRLAGDGLDDEAFLAICREAGLQREIVGRLVARGRADEALVEAARATDATLLELANLLVSLGQEEGAERLIRERKPDQGWEGRYLGWLRDRANQRGDTAEALALGEELFWHRPTLAGYEELQAPARAQGFWDDLRAAIVRRLARDGKHVLLTEIALREGDVPGALGALAKLKGAFAVSGGEPLHISVARAAEQSHPREALSIYRAAAEQLIRFQGRENYRIAAGYLKKARALHQRLGEEQQWRAVIAGLREEHKRLRALREELDRAGL